MYAGCQDGYVKVWDLDTRTLVRSLIVEEVRGVRNTFAHFLTRVSPRTWTSFPSRCSTPICTHAPRMAKCRYVSTNRYRASEYQLCHWQRWSASFNLTATWPAHSGIVLSSIVTRIGHTQERDGRFVLVTGANDDQIKVHS